MTKFFYLAVGVTLGFIGAHFVNQTPRGRHFFDQVNRGAKEFGDAVVAGYRGTDASTLKESKN